MTHRPIRPATAIIPLAVAFFGALALLLACQASAQTAPSAADFLPPGFGADDGANAALAHGAFWASVLLGAIPILRAVLARLQPLDVPPTWWQERTAPAVASLIALCGVVADALVGAAPWSAVVPVALAMIGAAIHAIDPPRGSKRGQAAASGTVEVTT